MTSKEKYAEVKAREIEGSGSRNKILLSSYSSQCYCFQFFSRICWLKLEEVLSTSNRGPSIPGFLFRFCARTVFSTRLSLASHESTRMLVAT
jgi:hypothetical protein